jgi:hypothetical protein
MEDDGINWNLVPLHVRAKQESGTKLPRKVIAFEMLGLAFEVLGLAFFLGSSYQIRGARLQC